MPKPKSDICRVISTDDIPDVREIVRKIEEGGALAYETVKSHKILYYALKSTQKSFDEVIQKSLPNWTENPGWYSLTDAEFGWVLHKISEDLFDFNRHIYRLSEREFGKFIKQTVQTTLSLIEIAAEPNSAYPACISYLTSFNIEDLFDEANQETRKKIVALNEERNEQFEILSINVFKNNLSWTKTSSRHPPSELWSLPEESIVDDIMNGQSVIADEETVRKRFKTVLCGVNPTDDDFPAENVVFAGGLISKITSSNYNPDNGSTSDVDMFMVGKDPVECATAVKSLMDYFTKTFKHVWFATFSSVCSIYILDVKRQFQIVSCNYLTPLGIIGRFDSTHVQWFYYKDQFYCTGVAYETARTRVAQMYNLRHFKESRLVKTFLNGYSVLKTDRVSEITSVERLISDKSAFNEILKDVYTRPYFPESVDGYLSEHAKKRIQVQISSLPRITHVSTSTEDTMVHFKVGGNFDVDYNGQYSSVWNPKDIELGLFKLRRDSHGLLKNGKGDIVFATPDVILRTYECTIDTFTLRFSFTAPPKFIEFIKMMEESVVDAIDPGQKPSNRLIRPDGICEMSMSANTFEYKEKTCRVIAKNQHGVKLNPALDIEIEHTVYAVFKVWYTRRDKSFRANVVQIVRRTPFIETGALGVEQSDDATFIEYVEPQSINYAMVTI